MNYVLYSVRRLITLIPVLFGISLVVFMLIHLIPGDPAVTLLGTHVTPAAVAALREQLGLDKPLWQQYVSFVGGALHGDLGTSYQYKGVAVTSLIWDNVAPTVWLIVAAVVFSVVICIPLAIYSASKPNSIGDNVIRTIPVIGLGMPSFWLGIMLILLFSLLIPLFPVSGFGEGFGGHLRAIVLPALTIALTLVPILIRSLRASMLEVLQSDYIVTARSKGISGTRVLIGHALRNAALASVTVLGINIAYLIGSTVVIEKVFALNGVGYLMLTGILQRDFPIVQAVTLLFAVMVVLVNLLTDLTHAALDPRVSLS